MNLVNNLEKGMSADQIYDLLPDLPEKISKAMMSRTWIWKMPRMRRLCSPLQVRCPHCGSVEKYFPDDEAMVCTQCGSVSSKKLIHHEILHAEARQKYFMGV